MEILTTCELAEAARGRPLGAKLGELAAGIAARPAQGADSLAAGNVVAWSRKPEQLSLWSCDVPAGEDEPPLAVLSRAELRGLGVPDAAIPAIARVRSLDELARLGLPAAVADRLRLAFVQRANHLAFDETSLARRALSAEHFADFLGARVADLLLNLDATQRQIVELASRQPVVVRGVAGSGKTAVIVHRVHHLIARAVREGAPRPSVLVLTFNRALASVTRSLLAAVGVERGRTVEVQTVHAWARRATRDRRQGVLDSRERLSRILRCVPRSALRDYPEELWDEEVHRIKGRLLASLEDYLVLRRVGAGRPLRSAARELVWRVCLDYTAACARDGVGDWDDLVGAALELAQREPSSRYDFVFVDEAQDFTVAALSLATTLARTPAGLFFTFDPAQAIYERSFRWRDAGIAVRGSHSYALSRNHRSSRAILAAARPLLSGLRSELASEEDAGAEDVLEPEPPSREGSAPRFLVAPPGQEHAAVAGDIRRLLEERRARPENIAVLCYPNVVRDEIHERLAAAGLVCQKQDHEHDVTLGDGAIKVLSMHSAKGLEFPVTYVVATGRLFRSRLDGPEGEAWTRNLRRVLYVALTRAMSELVIVHAAGDPPPFLGTCGAAAAPRARGVPSTRRAR